MACHTRSCWYNGEFGGQVAGVLALAGGGVLVEAGGLADGPGTISGMVAPCHPADLSEGVPDEAGVTVLAGTDVGNAGVARGAILLSELELLTDAGLSPVDALHAATGAPATRFPLGQWGRLAPDHRADLVLIDGDATQDITVIRDIDRVWRNGRAIERRP